MFIWVDNESTVDNYQFAYQDRNGCIEKVILATDRIQESNTVTICTADTNEVHIYISDIPNMIKALNATHSKALELRKDQK